jgi:hypothetical protein
LRRCRLGRGMGCAMWVTHAWLSIEQRVATGSINSLPL